jgi:hypothetical protein
MESLGFCDADIATKIKMLSRYLVVSRKSVIGTSIPHQTFASPSILEKEKSQPCFVTDDEG